MDEKLKVMMSQARPIIPAREAESSNPDSIYTRKRFTLEVRYGYVHNMQLAVANLRTDFEGKSPEELQAMAVSKGYQQLQGRLQGLAGQVDESLNMEEQLKKWCEYDPDQRRQIMLEMCYTVQKMFEIKRPGVEIEVLDNFYASKAQPAKAEVK